MIIRLDPFGPGVAAYPPRRNGQQRRQQVRLADLGRGSVTSDQCPAGPEASGVTVTGHRHPPGQTFPGLAFDEHVSPPRYVLTVFDPPNRGKALVGSPLHPWSTK